MNTALVSSRNDETSGGVAKCWPVFCQPRSFAKCCLEGSQLFFLNPVIQWLFSVSRISPSFCFKIPDRGLQIRQILDNKKPLGSSLFRVGQ